MSGARRSRWWPRLRLRVPKPRSWWRPDFGQAPLPRLVGATWLDARAGLVTALAEADVAVVAGGVTLYEACALGVPSVGLAVVPAQRRAIRAFAKKGAVIDAGSASTLPRVLVTAAAAVADLLRDSRLRTQTAGRAQRLVDGRGALRVAQSHSRDGRVREASRVNRRAILFDLDDTLYPYGAFVRSGFRAVARRLAAAHGLSPRLVLRLLRAAWTNGERGRELQALCARLGLPEAVLPSLVALMREHVPSLRLPVETRQVLQAMRRDWRIGIVTNGAPDVQRRKIAALGLAPLVDAVVCARECGAGEGKPDPAAFHAGLEQLQVSADAAVFVGNDPATDVAGANAVGMPVIHLVAATTDCPDGASCRGHHVQRLTDVPHLANQLVPLRTQLHGL